MAEDSTTTETLRINLPGRWFFQPEPFGKMLLRSPDGNEHGLWSYASARAFAAAIALPQPECAVVVDADKAMRAALDALKAIREDVFNTGKVTGRSQTAGDEAMRLLEIGLQLKAWPDEATPARPTFDTSADIEALLSQARSLVQRASALDGRRHFVGEVVTKEPPPFTFDEEPEEEAPDTPAADRAEAEDRLRDLERLLRALGLGDHARPQSPAEVFDLCLAEIARIRASQNTPSAQAGTPA